MKLHEIARRDPSMMLYVEPAGGIYDEFEVKVTYDAEEPSTSEHVPGDPSTREHHPGSLTIISVVLNQDVKNEAGKTWKKGSDAEKLPGWDKSDDKYVYDKVNDALSDD